MTPEILPEILPEIPSEIPSEMPIEIPPEIPPAIPLATAAVVSTAMPLSQGQDQGPCLQYWQLWRYRRCVRRSSDADVDAGLDHFLSRDWRTRNRSLW